VSDLHARAVQFITNEPDLALEIARITSQRLLANTGLTERQRELYEFIRSYSTKNGFSPTYEEMREHMNIGSKSGVKQYVDCLEQRGFIRLLPGRNRNIQIVELA